jgi:hypothetical protein
VKALPLGRLDGGDGGEHPATARVETVH